MLERIENEKINEYWPIVLPGLKSSLPSPMWRNSEKGNRVLVALLMNAAQLWVECKKRKDKYADIRAFVITSVFDDFLSGSRSLMVYAMWRHGDKPIEPLIWKAGVEKLNEFARENQCHQLTAYTDNDGVGKILKRAGWRGMEFLSIPVKGGEPQ